MLMESIAHIMIGSVPVIVAAINLEVVMTSLDMLASVELVIKGNG